MKMSLVALDHLETELLVEVLIGYAELEGFTETADIRVIQTVLNKLTDAAGAPQVDLFTRLLGHPDYSRH